MDLSALVGPDIEAGRQFVNDLERNDVPVTAALWQFDRLYSEEWELDIVTPIADEMGHKLAYRKVKDTLSRTAAASTINPLRLSVYAPGEPFIRNLRAKFLGRNDVVIPGAQPVGDHTIERGYIYFVK